MASLPRSGQEASSAIQLRAVHEAEPNRVLGLVVGNVALAMDLTTRSDWPRGAIPLRSARGPLDGSPESGSWRPSPGWHDQRGFVGFGLTPAGTPPRPDPHEARAVSVPRPQVEGSSRAERLGRD